MENVTGGLGARLLFIAGYRDRYLRPLSLFDDERSIFGSFPSNPSEEICIIFFFYPVRLALLAFSITRYDRPEKLSRSIARRFAAT